MESEEQLLFAVKKVRTQDSAFTTKTCSMFVTDRRVVFVMAGAKSNIFLDYLLHEAGVGLVTQGLIDNWREGKAEKKSEADSVNKSINELLASSKDNREVPYADIRNLELFPSYFGSGGLVVMYTSDGRERKLAANLRKDDYESLKSILPPNPLLDGKLKVR